MDHRVVETIRRGQAEMRDRVLADLLLERGVLSQAETAALTAVTPPGSLADHLVEEGRITPAQVEQLSEEMDLLESLDTAVEDVTPQLVREAARRPASRVGKYVLVSKLGAGGMGEVWRAWDYGLGRWVALKFLKVTDSKLIRRFMREATLLARLSHPNITQVFEIGIHENRPFLSMELVEGGAIGKEPLDRKEAATIVRDAARGVAYAHAQGIIHRDLKPSNLLRSADGRTFVTDFGLARMQKEGASLTASGAVLGTPSFMAPEQAQGLSADGRTDVYGLGATLFALIEGRPPFEGEIPIEIVRRVATAPAPSLSGASDDLVVVIAKAMERDRRDRYQTPDELVEDLQRYLDDEPVLAQPISTVERIWRKARRRPLKAAAVAALSIAVVVGTIYGAGFLNELRHRRQADAILTEVEDLRVEYRRYVDAGRWDTEQARGLLAAMEPKIEAALDTAPTYPKARLFQGRLMNWTERYAEGQRILDELLEERPDYHEARVARAKNALALATSRGWSPEPEAIATTQGMSFVHTPPPAESAELIELARDDFERLPEEHDERRLGLAAIAYFEGEYQRAAELLEPAVETQDYLNEERKTLSWCLLALGRFAEAEHHSQFLLQQGIFVADAFETRAFARGGQARFEEAIADLRSVQQMSPGRSIAFLPFWLFQLGRVEEALDEYSRMLDTDPDATNLLLGRALVRWTEQDWQGSLADAERATELEPGNPEAHYHRAMALQGPAMFGSLEGAAANQALAAALEALDRAIELEPDSSLYLGQRGTAHLTLGSYDAAIDDLRRAVELDPDYPNWNWMLGVALLNQGNLEDAEAQLDAAIEGGLDFALSFYQRGEARLGQGDCAGARADFEATNAQQPGYVDAELLDAWIAECAAAHGGG